MSTNIRFKRHIPILTLADVMQQIHDTPPLLMVWYRNHIICPTLPSSFMKF